MATFRRIVTDGPDLVSPNRSSRFGRAGERPRVWRGRGRSAAPTWDAEHHSRGSDDDHGRTITGKIITEGSSREGRSGRHPSSRQHVRNAEEDAFRRDFTINGLFYDIATYSVIDYVGGLGIPRSASSARLAIRGAVRRRSCPHAARRVMAARLEFDFDPLVSDAIAEHRAPIMKASPARLLEDTTRSSDRAARRRRSVRSARSGSSS